MADIADGQRAAAALHIEPDRHALYPDHFADQLRQLGDRSAELAGIDVQQRVLLYVRGALVEVEGDPEIAAENISGNVGHHGNRSPGDINSVDRSRIEMISENRVAGAVVGILPNPAWAQHPAIAYFEKTPFEVVGHFAAPRNPASEARY